MQKRCAIPILVAVALGGAAALPAVELGPGIELIPGSFTAGSQPDGNTIVLRGPEGLVVVDTGRHVEHTRRIVEYARAGKLDVRAVVNTHWHLDHVGGNVLLRKEFPGLRVVASDAIHAALGGFLANYRKQLEALVAEAKTPEAAKPYRDELALIAAGASLGPDDTVSRSESRTLAGRTLELHLEPYAVTAGDLWLYEPSSEVLIAGDLVTLPAPFLDTACPAGWQAALAHLAAVDFARLVPGHGAPMDRAAFERYRRAFDGLLACASSGETADRCTSGWIEAAGDLIAPAERDLAKDLVDYYVAQVLRGDPGKRAALCAPKPE
jgi:glyoxylase-like metal-dependent hydrolase (beta-lactamase superfamily II)